MAVSAHATGTKTPALGTFTVTIASPAVFTFTAHGLSAGDKLIFSTTGALPTGLTAGTVYYVISAGLTANAFEVSTTDGGSAVNTSGTQSGTHSIVSCESILSDIAAAATFQLVVDKNAMTSTEAIELRCYQIVLTGGTRRVADFAPFIGAPPVDDLIARVGPMGNDLTDAGSLRFSLRQYAGTARAFPWKVLKYL
jgi:hypothetical protein